MTPEEIQKNLRVLSKLWTLTDTNKIRHDFTFADFPSAMSFVNKVAALSENEHHHPDMHIHYNKIIVELWTHAVRGLSEKDFALAKEIELLT